MFATAPRHRHKGKRILLVEDEEEMRSTLRLILEFAGFKVYAVSNGQEALDLLLPENKEAHELLISDIIMPEMSGLELIDRITEAELRIPMMAISGYADKSTVVELMRKGCVNFIDKPPTAEKVVEAVSLVFDKVQQQEQDRERREEQLRLENERLLALVATYRKQVGKVLPRDAAIPGADGTEPRAPAEWEAAHWVTLPPAGNESREATRDDKPDDNATAAVQSFGVEKYEGVCTIKPGRDMTGGDCIGLCHALVALFDEGGRRFRFDLAQTSNVESCALGVLAAFAEMLKRDGGDFSLEVVGANQDLRDLFRLTGLDAYYHAPPPTMETRGETGAGQVVAAQGAS